MAESTDAGKRGIGLVYAVIMTQTILSAGTHVVAKMVARDIDPFTLTFIRSLIAASATGMILLARRRWIPIRRQDYRLILALSFIVVSTNQFLFLYGIRYTTPSNAALLYATTPIMVLLFSRMLMGEKLTGRKILGVALGFVGVAIVMFDRGVSGGSSYLMGNVLIFVAVLSWGLYTVYGKRLIRYYGPVQASSMTLICGTIMFLPVGAFAAVSYDFRTITGEHWMQILYLSLITSVVSYILWYYALSRIEAGKVAVFSNLQPILTAVLAFFVLGQPITGAFFIGGTVTIAGVVLTQRS